MYKNRNISLLEAKEKIQNILKINEIRENAG